MVQANVWSIGTLRTFIHWGNICATTRAPQSSKCGIVCLLMGATHITKHKYMMLSKSSILRYTTPEYALSDASEKLNLVRTLAWGSIVRHHGLNSILFSGFSCTHLDQRRGCIVSFIANMCVKQNALDFSVEYPNAAKVVNNSFYVDDCLTGSDSIQGAIELQCGLQSCLARVDVIRVMR